jgi:hypothetical protein
VGRPTLTADQAQEIRWLRATMGTQAKVLGEMYGASESSIFRIIHGWSFKTAGGPVEGVDAHRSFRNPNAEHGTPALWCRGCRCDICRDGNADRCAAWRKRTNHNGHRKVR